VNNPIFPTVLLLSGTGTGSTQGGDINIKRLRFRSPPLASLLATSFVIAVITAGRITCFGASFTPCVKPFLPLLQLFCFRPIFFSLPVQFEKEIRRDHGRRQHQCHDEEDPDVPRHFGRVLVEGEEIHRDDGCDEGRRQENHLQERHGFVALSVVLGGSTVIPGNLPFDLSPSALVSSLPYSPKGVRVIGTKREYGEQHIVVRGSIHSQERLLFSIADIGKSKGCSQSDFGYCSTSPRCEG
jgi:hypothetical protein